MGMPNLPKDFSSNININKDDIINLLKESLNLKEDSLDKILFNHEEILNLYKNNPDILSNLSHLDLHTLKRSFDKVYDMIEENKNNVRETSSIVRYFFKNEKMKSEQSIVLFILLAIVVAIKCKNYEPNLIGDYNSLWNSCDYY